MFGTNIDNIFVKLSVFRISSYDKNDVPKYSSFVTTNISFQRNGIESVEVNGYPFKIKMEYPNVDILYDNNLQDTLASIDVEEDDEVGFTTLNKLGIMFSVEIKLDKYEEPVKDKQDQQDFEYTIKYNNRYDLMHITMGYCPDDNYTLSNETQTKDGHMIFEDRTNGDDVLVGIRVFDFKTVNIDMLKEQYNDCYYQYWDKLKQFQDTIRQS